MTWSSQFKPFVQVKPLNVRDEVIKRIKYFNVKQLSQISTIRFALNRHRTATLNNCSRNETEYFWFWNWDFWLWSQSAKIWQNRQVTDDRRKSSFMFVFFYVDMLKDYLM